MKTKDKIKESSLRNSKQWVYDKRYKFKRSTVEFNRQILLNALYIVLSATIVFLQLVVRIPRLLRIVPFYRKSMYAIDKMFELREEEEFPDRSGKGKIKVKVGTVKRGETGFNDLLEAIKAHQTIVDVKVERIGLAYGDIQVPSAGVTITPNYMVFIQSNHVIQPIIYRPLNPSPSDIEELLLSWVKTIVQKKVATLTAIMAIVWVTIMTLLIYG